MPLFCELLVRRIGAPGLGTYDCGLPLDFHSRSISSSDILKQSLDKDAEVKIGGVRGFEGRKALWESWCLLVSRK